MFPVAASREGPASGGASSYLEEKRPGALLESTAALRVAALHQDAYEGLASSAVFHQTEALDSSSSRLAAEAFGLWNLTEDSAAFDSVLLELRL